MAHSASARRRFTIVVLTVCVALTAIDSNSATRKKSTKHKAAATTPISSADTPGVAGSLIRRSPWAALADLPNFTDGVWENKSLDVSAANRTLPPLKPELSPASAVDNSPENATINASCAPLGMPTVMLRPYPFEFVFQPGRVLILLELKGEVRRIYTDGRAHPDDVSLSRGGHSIGHWEKNTLVVDTVGLNDAQIAPGIFSNGPVHIVERMRLINTEALTIDTTVEAPAVLTRPWSYSVTYQRHHDWNAP